MVRIDEELVRKKAEHNEGRLTTLEEITLHQHEIEKIENLHLLCRHIQILYLQNNLIAKIENVSKLKELKYINLAVNNVRRIEGMEGCESLEKIDLTCNFVDDILSFERLQGNYNLKEMYLIGNPICDYEGYREFIVATLPQLERLDGKEISKAERIKAVQNLSTIRKRLVEEDAIRRQRPDYDEDPFGVVKRHKEEYAVAVSSFSSEGSPTDFNAGQLVGEPVVYPLYQEDCRCWAPQSTANDTGAAGAREVLELSFETSVYAHSINIFETYHPGCIVDIATYDDTSFQWNSVWSEPIQKHKPAHTARMFNPPIAAMPYRTRKVRLTLDTTRAENGNGRPQIDAVKLLGSEITAEEEAAAERERKERLEASRHYKDNSGPATKHTPGNRIEIVKEMAEQRDAKNKTQQEGRDKLTGVIHDETDEERSARRDAERIAAGELPRQTNSAGLNFDYEEDDGKGNTILDLSVPKYMDTSLLNLDVSPQYVRCEIKGRVFCLHLNEEINTEKSRAERSQITGRLKLTMPHAKRTTVGAKAVPKENVKPSLGGFHNTAVDNLTAGAKKLTHEERLQGTVDVRNIVAKDGDKTTGPLIQPHRRVPEPVAPGPDFVDDPDCPPLE